jgi:hypothetical protein
VSKRGELRPKLNPKANAQTPSITSTLMTAPRLFGPPQLLEGEDPAAYDELLGRVCAAVNPVDVIDEMLIADVVFLEWDVGGFGCFGATTPKVIRRTKGKGGTADRSARR